MTGRARPKSKKQLKLEAAKSRPGRYRKARLELRKRIKTRPDFDQFYPFFSRTVIKRIYDGESVGDIQKDRLIELLDSDFKITIYNAIAEMIEQTEERADIIKALAGDYRYFRCDTPPIEGAIELSEGRIRIGSATNGDVRFEHWSPDRVEDEAPEHIGFAFLVANKLYMLAGRPGVLRLGIAHCADGTKGVMSGFVLSIRSGDNNPIFAAPSILVREENTKVLAKLRSDQAISEFQKHHSAHTVGYMAA